MRLKTVVFMFGLICLLTLSACGPSFSFKAEYRDYHWSDWKLSEVSSGHKATGPYEYDSRVFQLEECRYVRKQYRTIRVNNSTGRTSEPGHWSVSANDPPQFLGCYPAADEMLSLKTGEKLNGNLSNNGKTNDKGQVVFYYKTNDPMYHFSNVVPELIGIKYDFSNVNFNDLAMSISNNNYFNFFLTHGKGRKSYSSAIASREMHKIIRTISEKIHGEKLRTIKIVPTNIDSKYQFPGSMITVSGKTPSASDILKPFFPIKEHHEYATSVFPQYLKSTQTIYETNTLKVFPGRYKL